MRCSGRKLFRMGPGLLPIAKRGSLGFLTALASMSARDSGAADSDIRNTATISPHLFSQSHFGRSVAEAALAWPCEAGQSGEACGACRREAKARGRSFYLAASSKGEYLHAEGGALATTEVKLAAPRGRSLSIKGSMYSSSCRVRPRSIRSIIKDQIYTRIRARARGADN
jgi:hypothetical protein